MGPFTNYQERFFVPSLFLTRDFSKCVEQNITYTAVINAASRDLIACCCYFMTRNTLQHSLSRAFGWLVALEA